jgi:hypothetical protein
MASKLKTNITNKMLLLGIKLHGENTSTFTKLQEKKNSTF